MACERLKRLCWRFDAMHRLPTTVLGRLRAIQLFDGTDAEVDALNDAEMRAARQAPAFAAMHRLEEFDSWPWIGECPSYKSRVALNALLACNGKIKRLHCNNMLLTDMDLGGLVERVLTRHAQTLEAVGTLFTFYDATVWRRFPLLPRVRDLYVQCNGLDEVAIDAMRDYLIRLGHHRSLGDLSLHIHAMDYIGCHRHYSTKDGPRLMAGLINVAREQNLKQSTLR